MDEDFYQKYIAIRRAEHRLHQRLETIEFEKGLKEEVEGIKAGTIKGKLPKITLER